MSEMTREHLEAVQVGAAALQDEASGAIVQSKMFAVQSASYAKYLHRAAWLTGKADRLAEVAAMIEAKLEEKL